MGEMITRFFFGPDAANIACAADERSQIAVRFMGSNVTLPKWLPHQGVRAAVAANQRLITAVGEQVRRRRAEQRTYPQDLLDLLLSDRRAALTDDQIVRLLRVSLLASYGSRGAALCWVVHILAAHPAVSAAIRKRHRRIQASNDRPAQDRGTEGEGVVRPVHPQAPRLLAVVAVRAAGSGSRRWRSGRW